MEIQTISKILRKVSNFKRKALSFFHLIVFSLTKKFDDFNKLLCKLNVSSDFLAISESQIKYFSSPI